MSTASQDTLYIWLNGEPGATPADVGIEDVPDVSDLDLLAEAIIDGRLGRYLPVTIHISNTPQPNPARVRAVDTARLLRERHIRHRRRYEVTG